MIIGALKMNSFFSGAAYVIYGSTNLRVRNQINTLVAVNQAVSFYGPSNSWFGYSVSGAGLNF